MLSAPLVAGRCGHGVRGPLSSAPSWGPRPAARPIHGRRVVRQTSSKVSYPTRPRWFRQGLHRTLEPGLHHNHPLSFFASPAQERESYTFSKQYNDDVYFKIRAEAEAPFRSFRLVIFGFLAASALSATLFGLPRVVGTLAGAPNAKVTAEPAPLAYQRAHEQPDAAGPAPPVGGGGGVGHGHQRGGIGNLWVPGKAGARREEEADCENHARGVPGAVPGEPSCSAVCVLPSA